MTNESISSNKASAMDFRIFEATPGKRVVFSPDAPLFTIVAVSHDMCQFVGQAKEQIIGKSIFDAFPANPDDPEFTGHRNLRASLEYVIRHKTGHQMERQRYDVATDGATFRQIYWSNNSVPLLSENGEVLYIIHTAEDVTDQVIAEQSKERMKGLELAHDLFMQAPTPIQIYKGPDLVLLLANEPTLKTWGKGPEVVGKPLIEALPEMQGQGFRELLLKVMQTGEPLYFYDIPVTFFVNGKEESGYYNSVYQPFFEKGKTEPAGVIVFGFDVTQRILAEKKANEIEQRFQNLIAQATVATAVYVGQNMKIEYANDAMIRLWGKDHSVIGKTVREALPELDDQPFHRQLDFVFSTGDTYWGKEDKGEIMVDGKLQTFYFNFSYKALRDINGVIYGILNMAVDVTEQVLARKKVEESEENLRNTILQAPVAMCILKGPQHVVEVANVRMLELWGKQEQSIMYKPVFEGLPEVTNQGFEQMLYNVFALGHTVVANEQPVTLPRNGKVELVLINFVYEPFVEDDKITGVMVVAIDVTDQVTARKKIEQKNNELTFVMDVMPQLVWHTQPDGTADFFNQVYLDYTGLPKEQLVGHQWTALLHPEDVASPAMIWQQTLSGLNKIFTVEHRLRSKDGTYRWFLSRGVPLKDEKEHVVKWYCTTTDIQDQKTASELLEQKVKERTIELEIRNKELEQFTYVSSHDLQEPLRKIIMFSDMVKAEAELKLSEASRNRLDKVTNAARRMSAALRDVLDFASLNKEEQYVQVDLDEVLATLQTDLELAISEKAAHIYSDELPTISAVPQQMHQLFYNLVNNALKFAKPGTPPVIYISCRLLNTQEIKGHPELDQSKQYYQVDVQDQGIGFTHDAADKIFVMFQRLHSKDAYAGTGIGLALCKKVVQNHSGKIWAEGKEGEGATFKVILPAG